MLEDVPVGEAAAFDKGRLVAGAFQQPGDVRENHQRFGVHGRRDPGGEPVAVDVQRYSELGVEREGRDHRHKPLIQRRGEGACLRFRHGAAVVAAQDARPPVRAFAQKILALRFGVTLPLGVEELRLRTARRKLLRDARAVRERRVAKNGALTFADEAALVAGWTRHHADIYPAFRAERVHRTARSVYDDPALAAARPARYLIRQRPYRVPRGAAYLDNSDHFKSFLSMPGKGASYRARRSRAAPSSDSRTARRSRPRPSSNCL